MLLQISEPGQSPEPHAPRVALGIDLGTTHSVVAVVQNGTVRIIEEEGQTLIPSVVGLLEGQLVVGQKALEAQDPLRSIKRLMGRGVGDAVLKTYPHMLVEEADGLLRVGLGDTAITPLEVSGAILRHLKDLAEKALSQPLQDVVITVPAHFDDGARQATKDAAMLAGFTVLRLINEPTAAALAYGLDKGAQGTYAIYDWGGGTFDFSLLRLEGGVFQVLATGGDLDLGGDDIDWELLKSLLGVDPATLPPSALQQELKDVRQAKEALAHQDSIPYRGTFLTREMLDHIARSFVMRTLQIAVDVLAGADMTPQEIAGIVLVGGSSRLLLVSELIEATFSRAPLRDIDPDQVVAMGAAHQAAALVGSAETLLLDVTPLSLGIETMGGIVEKIIPRNSPIPCRVSQAYTTYVDGQTGLSIHVVQGERELVKDCRSLAHFELKGLPVRPAGQVRVSIEFLIDADGILTVRAEETTTGAMQEIDVKPSYGLSEDQIRYMLEESWRHGAEDMKARLLAEEKVRGR